MELVLFGVLCLMAAVVSLFVIMPANYLQSLPLSINVLLAFFAVLALILFRKSCQGRCHPKVLFYLLLALLNLVWFPNGASHGSIPFYFFCIVMYVPIFFRGRERWVLVAIAITDIIALLVLELRFPGWVVPFRSDADRIADHVVGLVVTAGACTTMLWALLRRYDQEQERLVSVNDELQRTLLERALVEGALQQNREVLNAVIEGTTDAVFVKDVNGRYLLFNKASTQMTGKSLTEILGRDDTELFPPEVARLVMEEDQMVLGSNVLSIVEHNLTLPNGERILVEATKGPLHDKEGNVVGVFGIGRDITQTRRMADELSLLNEELERRVIERTARLEAAMKEQETFSYSVSHDLRGPLRHINSYTSIVLEEYGSHLPPDGKQYLERVCASTRRMGTLIDDLLELSRIGRSELNKVPVNLSEVAHSIGSKLQDAEPQRQVEILVEPDLEVHGDRGLLEQMLENLVANAWKYSSVRELARIEVGRSGGALKDTFFVRDNGVGFDMAYQNKLFGAFQRLHGSEFEGTGIGLATVKRIVERHGGSVWAHGVVDEGATVYFCLP
ncbi:MAG: PAS domain S-box protein [Geobacter sp.]|nr:MAG: PAS domain S-box protein [Geobacter sp.]